MLRGGTSKLGKMYLNAVKEGKICKCRMFQSRLCKECQKKEDEKNMILNRSKSIDKIKKKIKK